MLEVDVHSWIGHHLGADRVDVENSDLLRILQIYHNNNKPVDQICLYNDCTFEIIYYNFASRARTSKLVHEGEN